MTLNEAIEHAEWCADNSCGECAEEHRQLAEWLKRLQAVRAAVLGLERTRDQLKAENDRLQELVHVLWQVVNHNAKGRDGMIGYFDLLSKAMRLSEELGIEV